MRITVFGVGGVGGAIGAQSAVAGHETIFIARGEHLAAIQASGLTIEGLEGTSVVRPTLATANPAEAGTADVVFVCVKAWQLREAAEAILPLCGERTIVIPIQNGLEAGDIVGEIVGPDRTLIGVFETLSEVRKPGVISQRSRRSILRLGELSGGVSPRVDTLKQQLSTKELVVETPEDVRAAAWRKLLLIAPFGGVGSMTRSPIGIWRKITESRAIAEHLMQEIAAVAIARGVALGPQALAGVMRMIDVLPAESMSSMQRDLIAGRRSELDAQIGATIRLGTNAGIRTPVHECTFGALLPLELRAQGVVTFD